MVKQYRTNVKYMADSKFEKKSKLLARWGVDMYYNLKYDISVPIVDQQPT